MVGGSRPADRNLFNCRLQGQPPNSCTPHARRLKPSPMLVSVLTAFVHTRDVTGTAALSRPTLSAGRTVRTRPIQWRSILFMGTLTSAMCATA